MGSEMCIRDRENSDDKSTKKYRYFGDFLFSEDCYLYQFGVEAGRDEIIRQREKTIAVMLSHGMEPEQIVEDMAYPIELVQKIQQEHKMQELKSSPLEKRMEHLEKQNQTLVTELDSMKTTLLKLNKVVFKE